MPLESADVYGAMAAAPTAVGRWNAFTTGLADIGLDQINYAFLDFATYDRLAARGDPAMSTMRRDWIEYYADRRYDLDDELVAHVRAGRFDPKFYRTSDARNFGRPEIMHEAREAGMNTGFLVPLPGPWGDHLPAAGIVMGSSLGDVEAARITRDHAPNLIALAHVLHTSMSGELLRRRAGAAPLTGRERDCLQLTANGMRIARIADRLMLAEATVSLHLKNARKKLGARSLPEAVARAMIYNQIHVT